MKQVRVYSLRWTVSVLAAALLLLAAGCSLAMPGDGTMESDEMAMPTVTPGELTVVDVRSRATAPGAANGAAYLTVLNGTEAIVHLVSAESDIAESVELHETTNDNGIMRMAAQPGGFEIAPGESLLLEPGGKHVMLLGLNGELTAGESYDLTLNFDGMDPMPVSVFVTDISGQAVDHAAMVHEEMDEGGEMMESPAWMTEFEALDTSALHHIDDSLNVTGTLDAGFVYVLQTYQSGLTAIEWPDDYAELVASLDAVLTDLDVALQAEELETAAPLATEAHDLAHDLQHSIESHMGAGEHGDGEHSDGEHSDGEHSDGEHSDGEHEHSEGEQSEHEHEEEAESGE